MRNNQIPENEWLSRAAKYVTANISKVDQDQLEDLWDTAETELKGRGAI